jgi:hypothetical protein
MTLPNQPSSTAEVLANQEFFRIFQPVLSAGDIFEIDSSTRAIYIGPNSDLSEVRLQYYSRQALGADKMEIADVSVNGPFVGRLDSLLVTPYPNIAQPGRILAYPVDIVDPAYERPTGVLAVPARRFNVPPRIDLFCALKDLPSIPAVRADRTFRFPRVPFNNDAGLDDDGSTDIVIPIYGRRMVTVQIVTPVLAAHETSFFIAALQPGTVQPFPKFLGSIVKAGASVQTTDTVVYRASDQVEQVVGDGVTADPAMPTYAYQESNRPLPACKGMADLLIINIRPNFDPPPPAGYSLLDLFIKVSDREA